MNKRNQLPKEFRQERARKQQFLQEQAAVARLNKAGRIRDMVYDELPVSLQGCPVIVADELVAPLLDLRASASRRDELLNTFGRGAIAPYPITFVEARNYSSSNRGIFHLCAAVNCVDGWEAGNESLVDPVFNERWLLAIKGYALHESIDSIAKWRYSGRIQHQIYLSPDGDYITEDIFDSETEEFIINTNSFLDSIKLAKLAVELALFTFSFLNAKNTERIACVPNAELDRKYTKRFGRPMTRYELLRVQPSGKVSLGSGDSASQSAKKALHGVRGHFKDYRNGGGLYGRTHGVFWWDAFARGDEKEGVVLKDYKAVPNTEATNDD